MGCDVTRIPAYSDAEWGLLVGLPQSVVIAASTAETDSEGRTLTELQVGLRAIAAGRDSGSALVGAVAQEIIDQVGDPDTGTDTVLIEFYDPAAGIADVLDRAATASTLLAARATEGEAAAYAHWLVTIAEEVIQATRSGGVLGLGGIQVSAAEQQFRDRLAEVLHD